LARYATAQLTEESAMQTVTIDSVKLLHWLNARKITPPMASERAGFTVDALVDGNTDIARPKVERLAEILNVSVEHLALREPTPAVIYASKQDVAATKRPINRGGIHFYNYYTLPSPKGQISPVLIDILCPKDRMPTQNNGHLEPAITINLGPGNINGLWGAEINPHTWHVLHACRDGGPSWVMGDSYVEPAFCPHTYSRASDEPAQILSYTVKSNLESFLAGANGWAGDRFEGMVERVAAAAFPAAILKSYMERHGYDATSLAAASGISGNALTAFLEGDEESLAVAELKTLGRILAMDYRLLLKPITNHDPVGKTLCTIAESRASIRRFKSYTVASMSAAPSLPDLTGLFMKVDTSATERALDLNDHSASHYYTTGGAMIFRWAGGEQTIEAGDALWVGPYVRHGFSGNGSLIKMGNGEGTTYLDQFEMSNSYQLADTLRRGWRDRQTWTPLHHGGAK